MLISKKINRRGHTFAVVSKPESVSHLEPNSEIHALHRDFASQLKASTRGLITADVSPPGALKFPSLQGGLIFDADGHPMAPATFEQSLNAVRTGRNYYLAPVLNWNGRPLLRRRRCEALRQIAITVLPTHSMALSLSEAAGIESKGVVTKVVAKLRETFVAASPYELIAIAVHPEEGALHCHVAFSVVSEDHRLLHKTVGRGQPARNFLGVGKIATLRIVDADLWPQSDANEIRQELASKISKFGATPIDYRLSMTVDEELERYFYAPANAEVQVALEVATSAYKAHVQKVRSMRLDVMIAELEAMRRGKADDSDRINKLEAEAAALRAAKLKHEPMPSVTAGILTTLRDLSHGMGDMGSGTPAPDSFTALKTHLRLKADGSFAPSVELKRAVRQSISDRPEIAPSIIEAYGVLVLKLDAFALDLPVTASSRRTLQFLQDAVRAIAIMHHDGKPPERLKYAFDYLHRDASGGWTLSEDTLVQIQRIADSGDELAPEVKATLAELQDTLKAAKSIGEISRDIDGPDLKS